MIDKLLIRNNPEVVIESQKKRYAKVDIVEECIKLDKSWREATGSVDTIKMKINKVQDDIKIKKKADKTAECKEELAIKIQLEAELKLIEAEKEKLDTEFNKKYTCLGNIVHESVPVSDDENNNLVVSTWGEPNKIQIDGTPGKAHHHQILWWLGGYDPDAGQKVAGHKGYFLKGPGVLLNQALIQYGLRFLAQKNYDLIQPPYFMKKDVMAKTAQLSDFDEQLYKVEGGDESYYLIATAEQPISTMHMGDWLEPKQLPLKYAGCSPCFRKEAGAHGRDVWGIFRVHQFEKVEQFAITTPEDSWKMHEEMIKTSEEFYQSLKLPYRVISIVSGALNDAAAKKYDLEAWFPGYNSYRELVSCSNCTDYQSRSSEIRLRSDKKKDDTKKYVHMLNGTLTATERTLCCLLENYQTETGVKVPEVLIPFVGTDFLPYKHTEKLKSQIANEEKEKKKDGEKPKKENAKKEEKKTEEPKK